MPLIYVLCCVCKFCMVCLHVDVLDYVFSVAVNKLTCYTEMRRKKIKNK